MTEKERAELRRLVADYMHSEGCSCCRDINAHEEHAAALAKILKVPAYADGSGFDFYQFRTDQR
ncbi:MULTISPECIES: hypothetical protein [unclassified Bradyrhizobium]|nr:MULTISPECIES: hypothetical protein [unclassified Bradyrhizobium]